LEKFPPLGVVSSALSDWNVFQILVVFYADTELFVIKFSRCWPVGPVLVNVTGTWSPDQEIVVACDALGRFWRFFESAIREQGEVG